MGYPIFRDTVMYNKFSCYEKGEIERKVNSLNFVDTAEYKNDVEEIKAHEYFKDINWDDVYDRKLSPPIPPKKMSKKKGIDINGNLIIELAVFDSVKEAQMWCDRENKFNETYNL